MISLRKKIASFFIALLSVIGYGVVVFATQLPALTPPPPGGYSPGNSILDPGCVPGGPNCFQNTGIYMGQGVVSGTPSQVLYLNNAGQLAGDGLFTRDSITGTTQIVAAFSGNDVGGYSIDAVGGDVNSGIQNFVTGEQIFTEFNRGGGSLRGGIHYDNPISNTTGSISFNNLGNTLIWDADTTDSIIDGIQQGNNINGAGYKGIAIAHNDTSTFEAAALFAGDTTSTGGTQYEASVSYVKPGFSGVFSYQAFNQGLRASYRDDLANIYSQNSQESTGNTLSWNADTTDGIITTISQSQNILGLGFASGSALSWADSTTGVTSLVASGDFTNSGGFPGTASLASINGNTASSSVVTTRIDANTGGSEAFSQVGNGTIDTGWIANATLASLKYKDTATNEEGTIALSSGLALLGYTPDGGINQSFYGASSGNIGMGFSSATTLDQFKISTGRFEAFGVNGGVKHYLDLDSTNRLYQIGDIDTSYQGTSLRVNDATKLITARGDLGFNVEDTLSNTIFDVNAQFSQITLGGSAWDAAIAIDAISKDITFRYDVGSYTFPVGHGTAGQVMVDDGSGNLSWAVPPGDNCGTGYCFTIDGNSNMFAGVGAGVTLSSGSGNNNLFIGFGAGASSDQGSLNVGIGTNALYSNTTGIDNTAVGYLSMVGNIGGSRNSAFGRDSLISNTNGDENTVSGYEALYNNSSGSRNVFSGYQAGFGLTGNEQVGIGYQALKGAIVLGSNTGYENTAVGYRSLYNTSSGYDNTALGYQSGIANTSGHAITAFGAHAAEGNTTGNDNLAFGTYALAGTSTGTGNIAIGNNSLLISNAANNFAVGHYAGSGTTSGAVNLFIGNSAGLANVTGSYNSYIGFQAGSNDNGNENTAIGLNAGLGSPGSAFDRSVSIGNYAGQSQNFFGANVLVGWSAGTALSGGNSVMVGYEAGYSTTNQWSNVMIGYQAGHGNISGSNNMYLGALAGQDNVSGSWNVALGDSAGAGNVSGSNNVFLGSNSSVSADGWTSSIALGRAAQVTKSHQMVIGSALYYIDEINMVSSGGTSCAIDVNGTACSSDERLKTNIADLSSDVLSGLTQVRTVTFNWKEGTDTASHIGFIAQDLQRQYPELVSVAANGYLQVNYAGMAPVLTEAIRELNTKLTAVQNFSTSTDHTFVNQLVAWLGSATNGIENIFTKKVTTEQICVTDAGGETCLNRSQVNQLLNTQSQSGTTGGPQLNDPPVPDPTPVPNPNPSPNPDPTGTGDGDITPTDGTPDTPPSDVPPAENPPETPLP